MVEHTHITVAESKSILKFVEEGDETWPRWDRFLKLGKKKAYHIGNICDTCKFFFERLEGADKTLDATALADALGGGLETLEHAPDLARILPDGDYTAILTTVEPKLTMPGDALDYFANEQAAYWGLSYTTGLPHYPRTPYYRARTRALSPEAALFEFVVPMMPPRTLNADRLRHYRRRGKSDPLPTAVAVSVLDVKEFHDYNDDNEEVHMQHWCLAHYLLDGHHKTHAASLEDEPVSLLSFLALGKGVASEEERRALPGLLAGKE